MTEPWLLALCVGMAVISPALAVAARDSWGIFAAIAVVILGFAALAMLASVVISRRERALRDSATRDEFDAAERAAIEIAAATLSASHAHTAEHSDDVAELSGLLCEEFEVGGRERKRILAAARLHDIGKLAISREILNKPDALDADEWDVIKQHTVVGEQIMRSVPELESVAPLVRHSHEHWDGTGYPDGLSGEEIPLGSRIILCADAFHAIRSDRPYRRARTPTAAFAEMKAHAGTQFDPEMVEALEEYSERLSKRVSPRIRLSRRMVALLVGTVLALLGTALALDVFSPSKPGADQPPAVPQVQPAAPASPATGKAGTEATGGSKDGAGKGAQDSKQRGAARKSSKSGRRGVRHEGVASSSSGTSTASSSSVTSTDRGSGFDTPVSNGDGPDFETPVRAHGHPTQANGVARGRPITVVPRGRGK